MGPTESSGEDEGVVRLRPALVTEADRLALLQLRARAATTMPPGVHDLISLSARLAEQMAQDETWVAEADGAVVGYVRFTEEWLDDIYVDPAWSRIGIGAALLDLVKSRIPGGFGLWVFEENAGARAFYARHGLLELETTDGSANEERCPDVRTVWPGSDPRRHLACLLDDVEAQLGELRLRRDALVTALVRLDASVDTRD
ncbi:GNAT family N-acetyltransferase [Nocardioides gilvus]|uniref:GNAT family N-acetyltransferase n=1 Tax=Nocardioides gilvus TaxID=1735589 RepID=UPI000D748FE8|nr:GNAT family N-acetyltransferase [Nocardioides gilvus]